MDVCTVVTICIALLAEVVSCHFIKHKRGPYNIVVRQIEECGNEKSLIRMRVKTQTTTHSVVIVGSTIISNVTIDNNIKMKVIVDEMTPQGWKENIYQDNLDDKGFCSAFGQFFAQGKGVGGLNCSIQKGTFQVNDCNLRVENFLRVPTLDYNKYRCRVYFHYPSSNSPSIGCMNITVDVVPKRGRHRSHSSALRLL